MLRLLLAAVLAGASLPAAQLMFSTAFGGTYRFDEGTIHIRLDDSVSVLGVDRYGNTYVGGVAFSAGFPLLHPIQRYCGSQRCPFVAKLGPDGTLLYSTYVGDPVEPRVAVGEPFSAPLGMVCDLDGNVYITGATGAAQLPQVGGGVARSAGGDDAFVVKLDSNGALKATMLIGGSGPDAGTSLALGPDGYLYVVGGTLSKDFPVNSVQSAPTLGPIRVFVLKIDPKLLNGDVTPSQAVASSAIVLSQPDPLGSDFGPQYSYSLLALTLGLGVDAFGNVYLAHTGTITKFDFSGRTGWNFLVDGLSGFAVDAQGYSYVSGSTSSSSFRATPGAYRTNPGGKRSAFAAKINPEGTGFVFATFLDDAANAIAVDDARNVYLTGATSSSV